MTTPADRIDGDPRGARRRPSGGWLGLVVARIGDDRLLVVAAWLTILIATTAMMASAMRSDAAARTAIRQAIGESAIDIAVSAHPEDFATTDTVVREELGRALGAATGATSLWATTDGYRQAGRPDRDIVLFGSVEGLEDHARLVAGDWPAHQPAADGSIRVAISSAAAERLGVELGEQLVVQGRGVDGRWVVAEVGGIWEPIDPQDPWWFGDALALEGAVEEGAGFTALGPLMADRQLLVEQLTDIWLDLRWRTLPDAAALDPANVDGAAAGVRGLDGRIEADLERKGAAVVTSDLPEVLTRAAAGTRASTSGILLLDGQVIVLGGYALIMVAAMVVERRRGTTATLRVRGATTGQLLRLAAGEALLLVLPAIIVAPVLAMTLLLGLGALAPPGEMTVTPRLTSEAILLAVIAAGVAVVGMAIPILGSSGPIAATRRTVGRQLSRTVAHRTGLDLAFLIFAAVLLWELRINGAPISASFRGSIGIDPLLVAAPAIGLAAGAILTMRVVPTLATALERLVARRPGVVASMATRSIARRSSRYSRSALLLVVAVAIAFLAATYERTWRQSQIDQLALSVPTDLLAVPGAAAAETPNGPVAARAGIEGIDGVATAAPVAHQRFDLRRAGGKGTILALSPELTTDTVRLPGGPSEAFDASSFEALEAARPTIGSLPLPGRPNRLRLAIESDVATRRAAAPTTISPAVGPLPLTVSAVVRDAAGLLRRVTAATTITGDGVVELDLRTGTGPAGSPVTAVEPEWPLELVAVELAGDLPAGTAARGRARLAGLETTEATTGESGWSALDLAVVAPGWTYAGVTLDRFASAARVSVDGPLATVALDADQPPVGLDRLTLRTGPRELAEVGDVAVPALVDGQIRELAAIGSEGQMVVAQGYTGALPLEVVGDVELAPTLDPAEPGAIVDLPTLMLRAYAQSGAMLPADGWWLSLESGADAGRVADALAGATEPLEVTADRNALLRARADDPFQGGVNGVLAVVAGAALLFAAVGLAISLWYTVSSRQGEFAVASALGLRREQLLGWLAIESAFLIVVGVLGGLLVGLVLAWVVMPSITLTAEGRPPVPEPAAAMAWDLVLALATLGLLAFGLSVLAARRAIAGVRVAATLRVLEADR